MSLLCNLSELMHVFMQIKNKTKYFWQFKSIKDEPEMFAYFGMTVRRIESVEASKLCVDAEI